jgi:hypothetical protein
MKGLGQPLSPLNQPQKKNSADFKWLQQVKRSGTTTDKVAAMTLMIRVSDRVTGEGLRHLTMIHTIIVS